MAKAIMIQGTMSDAGKSLIAAGLCRIFKQEGFRAAPFKSQNMALNSYITEEGLEMGRAQAVQAEAAGLKPSVCMNPILLKPTTDTGSQVIVNGAPVGVMPAREYFRYKKKLVPVVREAYEKLAREADIIVIEGAGSPAEINLKQEDIVNMGMARMAKAPVLLVGDIDRGGVFAQLCGTMMLLTAEEREMVKGLVVNKFRGDRSILDPGIRELERLCGVPVIGVVPYMQEVNLEAEDSLSLCGHSGERPDAAVDLAVLRFPRISNFTDFGVFSCMPEVSLRYVSKASELGSPDLILLPGTKNTIDDLLWMRQNGLEAAVLKLAARGTPVFGICGGYQMMGESLWDKDGVESPRVMERVGGMGLLPVSTVYGRQKMRTRVYGVIEAVGGVLEDLSGMAVEGYEIHMGRTEGESSPLTRVTELQAGSGAVKTEGSFCGSVYGTYLHGFFDREGIARAVVNALLKRRGLAGAGESAGTASYREYKEHQYDLLAEGLRASLDMEAVYGMLGQR